MANRTTKTRDSSAITSTVPSRAASPANVAASPRTSTDSRKEDRLKSETEVQVEPVDTEASQVEEKAGQEEKLPIGTQTSTPLHPGIERCSMESQNSRT